MTQSTFKSRLWALARSMRDWAVPLQYIVRRPVWPDEHRYTYQRQWIRHKFSPEERVLDVGSGGDPFPHATLLAERFLEPSRHRSAALELCGKPIVVCDVQALPFADHEFDYVVCAHVLEHVDDPIRACRELQRVGRAGYIETPALLKDALFAWAKGMHRWHVVLIGKRLVLFEYSERQAEGIRSSAWERLIFGRSYHPLQEAFNANQDLFNVVFEWESSFDVTVMRCDGSVETL